MSSNFEPFLNDLKISECTPGVLLHARFDDERLADIEIPFDLPSRLTKAVQKRRAEFCAGRLLCHIGQKLLGLETHFVEADASRAPIWPPNVAGSITHSRGHAVVWVAARPDVSLGVDIEPIAGKSALEAILSSVLNDEEVGLASGDPSALTAMFSAKETLYKTLYPHVNRFFGFKAAKVIACQSDVIALELTEGLAEKLSAGRRFDVLVEHVSPGIRTRLCIDGA